MSDDRRAFFRGLARAAAEVAGPAAEPPPGAPARSSDGRRRPLFAPARAPRVERGGAARAARGERARRRRRRARLAGRGLPRGRRRGPAGHRRLRRRRGLEPPPPAAALHARRRRRQGPQRGGEAALPQPRRGRRALPGALRAADARGRRPGRRLLGLVRDPLRGQRGLLRGADPARRGRRGRARRARDGDPAGRLGLLPLRVPGAAAARLGAELRGGRRARPGRRRDRLAAGARGAEAAGRAGWRAARRLPPGRPARPHVPARERLLAGRTARTVPRCSA